ncbi:MAG: PP2C family protein-serine/threonine phosphatase [Bacteroidia bacterium]
MFIESSGESISELLVARPDIYPRKELDDSIIYAKRIQDGMMLKEKHLQRIFPQSFIYMRPRNIVSGDFYWFTRINNKIIIAAADCTGHGIPGALMSILGINLLNQIIIEEKNTDPAFILHRLDHKVNKAFSYTSDMLDENFIQQHTDGMDIALCCIDNNTGVMQFAGAYRPVYYIREGELNEMKGSRHPIGGNGSEPLFTNYTLHLQEGDKIYMCSDGYASQFGFLVNKKFSSQRMKDILLQISNLPFSEQKAQLDRAFMEWKMNLEQTDDVMVVGFEF